MTGIRPPPSLPARYLALCKLRIGLLVTAAAMTGYLAARPGLSPGLLWTGAGVLLLAAGAAALNEYQDREVDARMDRTRGRPIPRGWVEPRRAAAFSAALIAAGLLVLGRGGAGPALLGAMAAVWYNGLYPRLKKRSPVAAVPGAFAGALAPAIGWSFAGGRLDDPRIAALALVLFVWQVPHSWLLVLDRAEEYRGAGAVHFLDVFTEDQARRVISAWVVGTAAVSLLMAAWSPIGAPATRWSVAALSLGLASGGLTFRMSRRRTERALFRTMNFHMLALLALIAADRLIG